MDLDVYYIPDSEHVIVLAWQVEEAGSRVEAELGRILGVAKDHAALSLSSPGSRPVAVYDPINNGVWVKIKGRSGRNVSVRPSPELCKNLPGSPALSQLYTPKPSLDARMTCWLRSSCVSAQKLAAALTGAMKVPCQRLRRIFSASSAGCLSRHACDAPK